MPIYFQIDGVLSSAKSCFIVNKILFSLNSSPVLSVTASNSVLYSKFLDVSSKAEMPDGK